jgi:phosphatidate cytidylyltransferase
MKTRTITAIVMALILIPILIWGDHFYIFSALCILLSFGAAFEFRKMYANEKRLPLWVDILTILFTGGACFLFILVGQDSSWVSGLLALILVVLVIFGCILTFVNDFKAIDFGNAIATMLYCSAGFASLAILRHFGINIVIYLVLVSMVTDLFAYWFGIKFGRHKLIPAVSPKKSVEGAIAGLAFATVLGSVFGILTKVFGNEFPWFMVIPVSVILSILSQIGDLVASKFKRSYLIKDYSNIFPGHGGILDRFDSIMFTAMVLLAIVKLVSFIS